MFSRSADSLLLVCCLGLATLGAAEWQRDAYLTADGDGIRVYVPATHPEAAELAGRAIALYDGLRQASGLYPPTRLHLIYGDRPDSLDGFSRTIPLPQVFVSLAAESPQALTFFGDQHLAIVTLHELMHHLANEMPQALGRVFGRVEPQGDLVSLLLFLGIAPRHLTMPPFWQEGLAQWAETAYVDSALPWGGRGRGSLVNAEWRLATAAGVVPEFRDWRRSLPRWPLGNTIYLYGLAYLRYLDAQLGLDVWDLLRAQQRQGLFQFDAGARPVAGRSHGSLLQEARRALIEEQQAQIRHLQEVPLSTPQPLLPSRWLAGVPAWGVDGAVFCPAGDLYGSSRLLRCRGAEREPQRVLSWADSRHLRSAADGSLVWTSFDSGERARLQIWRDGALTSVPRRGRWPSLARRGAGYRLAYISETGPGRVGNARQLHLLELRLDGNRCEILNEQILTDIARPWSPALSPDGEQLAWLETTAAGEMHLHLRRLGPEAGPDRRLWSVPARLALPAWAPDGSGLYVCSDVSGVFNAYFVAFDSGEVRPVTHVLGAVTACVPSPDGSQLALRQLTADGPTISLLSADPALRPSALPQLPDPWQGADELPALVPLPAEPPTPATEPYHGLSAIRFRYWTPVVGLTTLEGGSTAFGVAAQFSDPVGKHSLHLSAGISDGSEYDSTGVGRLRGRFTLGWPDLQVDLWREATTFPKLEQATNGSEFDYSETRQGLRLGLARQLRRHGRDWHLGIGALIQDHDELDRELPASVPRLRPPPPLFTGTQRAVELHLGISDLDTAVADFGPIAGYEANLLLRASGLGGDLNRRSATLTSRVVLPLHRRQGFAADLVAIHGTSDGDSFLQGTFQLGSADTRSTGDHLARWQLGLRLPVWRPMRGFGTTPLVFRQLVLEPRLSYAQVSEEHLYDDGDWYGTASLTLHAAWEFFDIRLTPSLTLGQQLDHDKDFFVSFGIGGF